MLAKYGALCRLLLRLRRVGGMLDGAWAAMRSGGRPGLASQLATRAGSRSDSPRCAFLEACIYLEIPTAVCIESSMYGLETSDSYQAVVSD